MDFRAIVLLGGLALSVFAGCGGTDSPVDAPVPARQPTAGDPIMAAAPAGADLILEVDLRRLRENPMIGPLLESVAAPESLRETDLLQTADIALLCIYDIGDRPRQIVILQSQVPIAGTRDLGDGMFAVGDRELLARAEALPESGKSMADDTALLGLRAQVMPEKALHAVLRMAARLDFDARVSIAAEVDVSEVPVRIAVWGDVIDDLAIVVDLKTEEVDSLPKLERAVMALKARLGRQMYVRYLGLSRPLGGARVVRTKDSVRVVFVVGPQRLAFLVGRLQKQLQRQTDKEDS